MIEPFVVYKNYVPLKLFFENRFDLSKYGYNSINVSRETFLKRKDRRFFSIIAKRLNNEQEAREYFIAQFLYNSEEKSYWIGNFCSETAESAYKYHMTVLKGGEKRIRKEFEKILEMKTLSEIVDLVLSRKLSYNVLVREYDTILQKKFGEEESNFLWDSVIQKKIDKYKQLLKI